MKRICSSVLCFILCFTQIACGSQGVAYFLAGMGIGDAALIAYCSAGGSGCSPGLLSWNALVTAWVTTSTPILESGQSTPTKIAEVLAILQKLIAQGQGLAGLTPQQQGEVSAILAGATAVANLLVPLLANAAASSPASAPVGSAAVQERPRMAAAVIRWKVTAADHAKLVEMRSKMITATGAH